MTELEELMAQRKALDERIEFLKNGAIRCGRIKCRKETYAQAHEPEWVLDCLVYPPSWRKGASHWKCLSWGNINDVVKDIDALVEDLIEIRGKVRKE